MITIVDIQPCYEKWMYFSLFEFANYLNRKREILYYYNGPDIGCDNINDLTLWLMEYGTTARTIERISFIEKDYGCLRDWIDSGISDTDIISALKKKSTDDIYIPHWMEHKPVEKTVLMGGGKDQCLKEVALLFDYHGVNYRYNQDFIYG